GLYLYATEIATRTDPPTLAPSATWETLPASPSASQPLAEGVHRHARNVQFVSNLARVPRRKGWRCDNSVCGFNLDQLVAENVDFPQAGPAAGRVPQKRHPQIAGVGGVEFVRVVLPLILRRIDHCLPRLGIGRR